MGKNNIGLDYKYYRLKDVFYDLGRATCSGGLTPKQVLEGVFRLNPDIDLGIEPIKFVEVNFRKYSCIQQIGRVRAKKLFELLPKPNPRATPRYDLAPALWDERAADESRSAGSQHEQSETEGLLIPVTHLRRERGRIAARFKQQLEKLSCEACGFDFEKAYGSCGRGFIEAHHIIPLHEGVRETSIEDFRAVCSNCHRMLHWRRHRTVDELRTILETQKLV